jgi:hypothetical protein
MTPTLEELARVFCWHGMRDWVRHYIGRCVHCRTSNDVARVKCAFHASVTATAPNEVLCYDLVHIASEARLDKPRDGGFKNSLYPCLLVLLDRFEPPFASSAL